MAASGRPRSGGLDYFPKMVNFYEDDKIFDLLDEYGPLGVTIYDCILTIVYSHGYFANLSKDKLSRMVIRKIGSKWIKSKKVAVQVIDFCADIGLLSKDLVPQGIITSVGIQKRYYKIAVKLMKRQLYNREYWLLDENGELLVNVPKNPISSEETPISSEEINLNSEETLYKRKENKRKVNKNNIRAKYSEDEDLNRVILDFLEYRKKIGKPMTDHAVGLMMKKLSELSQDKREQIQILEQSIMNGWQGVFPLRKDRQRSQTYTPKPNQFHNFDQRETDYDALIREQVKAQMKNQKNE